MNDFRATDRTMDGPGRLARTPISRRRVLAAVGGALALGSLAGVLWTHRAWLRNTLDLQLWPSTPFDRDAEVERCRLAADAIRPLFQRKRTPGPGDWLAAYDEPGQTFNAYLRQFTPANRDTPGPILILPLGDFDARLARIVADTVELAGVFYGRSVQLLPAEPLPATTPATSPEDGRPPQLLTLPLLEFLKQRVPSDATALLAMTPTDLTPGAGWNFVFGQASLVDRVGVWSLHRLADPRAPAGLQLRRAAGVAVHELGHMVGIRHCTAYECRMNGANTMRESDAAPIGFCPECDAKLWWRLRIDLASRYEQLAEFASRRGWARDAEMWTSCSAALRKSVGSDRSASGGPGGAGSAPTRS